MSPIRIRIMCGLVVKGVFLGFILLNSGLTLSAQERSGKPDWQEKFAILAERNIFDPERRVMRDETPPPRPPAPPEVETFSLAGTLLYSDKSIAFFLSGDSEKQGSRLLNEEIAGFLIKEITQEYALLNQGEREIKLDVGSQLKRVGDGAWEIQKGIMDVADRAPSTSSSMSSRPDGSSAPPVLGGDADEILKQLLQRRQQELNQ